MLATGFDTHETVKRLIEAGASEPLAEAIVSAIGDVGERAASKADLDRLEASIRAGMDAHRAAGKADLDALKADMDAHRAAAKADMDAHRAAAKADMDTHRAATGADLDGFKAEMIALETRMEGRLYRALWLQGAGIVAVVAALGLVT